ncbi:hypothetical protein GWI33_011105 [Rhynchophorus ferrugineus]|uniref:Uncharacterized protein n=1 Tax=Rhynchophorus ferrugineus TaxID=354439 RepID=A0A834J1P0_RHYFE|nr:hypothetical protein GWI33_011105 [Rhynchophorus ferrugineus]
MLLSTTHHRRIPTETFLGRHVKNKTEKKTLRYSTPLVLRQGSSRNTPFLEAEGYRPTVRTPLKPRASLRPPSSLAARSRRSPDPTSHVQYTRIARAGPATVPSSGGAHARPPQSIETRRGGQRAVLIGREGGAIRRVITLDRDGEGGGGGVGRPKRLV